MKKICLHPTVWLLLLALSSGSLSCQSIRTNPPTQPLSKNKPIIFANNTTELYTKKEAIGQVPSGFYTLTNRNDSGYSLAPTYESDITGDGFPDLIITASPKEYLSESNLSVKDQMAMEKVVEAKGNHFTIFIGKSDGKFEKAIHSQKVVSKIDSSWRLCGDIHLKENATYLSKNEVGRGFALECSVGGTLKNTSTFTFVYDHGSWKLARLYLEQADVAPSAADDPDDPGHASQHVLNEKDFGTVLLQDFNPALLFKDKYFQDESYDYLAIRDADIFELGQDLSKPKTTIQKGTKINVKIFLPGNQVAVFEDQNHAWLKVKLNDIQLNK